MGAFQTIDEFERAGWGISVQLAPDYDYQPGYDDDVYPRLTAIGSFAQEPPERDYDGRFLPQPIIVWGRRECYEVSVEEIQRLIEVGGMNKKRARSIIADDAAAIVSETLSWVVVRVAAKRGGIEGNAVIGGVDYDLRNNADKYAREIVEEYAMVEEAIEDAVRSAVGGLAPLALSYD
jgi:hypothetical protein